MKQNLLKKLDLVILFNCIICFTLAYLLLDYYAATPVSQITVRQAGKVVYQETDAPEKEIVIKISGPLGVSEITITAAGAAMTKTPCPDKLCFKQHQISHGVIVCVPQQIIVQIERENSKNEYDAIIR